MAVAGGAGCGLIVLMEFLLIWFVVQSMFSATLPEGLLVRVKAPLQAQQRKAVPLSFVIRNNGDQPFTVRGLTVRSSTRKSFLLDQPSPAPTVPKTSVFGTDTWVYNQTVAPGGNWSVQLQATPLQAGKLRGTVEVQVDRGVRQARFTIVVTEAEAATDKGKPKGSRVKP